MPTVVSTAISDEAISSSMVKRSVAFRARNSGLMRVSDQPSPAMATASAASVMPIRPEAMPARYSFAARNTAFETLPPSATPTEASRPFTSEKSARMAARSLSGRPAATTASSPSAMRRTSAITSDCELPSGMSAGVIMAETRASISAGWIKSQSTTTRSDGTAVARNTMCP